MCYWVFVTGGKTDNDSYNYATISRPMLSDRPNHDQCVLRVNSFVYLSSLDLQNHQHVGALVRGRPFLTSLQRARVQDSRLPLVSSTNPFHPSDLMTKQKCPEKYLS